MLYLIETAFQNLGMYEICAIREVSTVIELLRPAQGWISHQ